MKTNGKKGIGKCIDFYECLIRHGSTFEVQFSLWRLANGSGINDWLIRKKAHMKPSLWHVTVLIANVIEIGMTLTFL